MKSRSRTASSQWPAGLNRPTSPSVRSPKAPSNVVVTTPLVPAQVVIQGGWTPAGLAVNVGRHHSRSIASSHDSEVNILPNDTRLPATGSKSVDNRFAVLPSLPERSKSREFDGSLHAVLRKSVSVVSAKSTGKSAGSSIWSKSAYTEMLPVAHCSKSVAVKRSGVIVAFSASPHNASVFERHGKLAALLADSPTQQRTAFRRSDSVAGSGNQRDMKKGTAQGLLGHPVSKILMSAEHLKLPKKRSASSQRSRSGILKTTRTSQGGSFVPSPHAEEVTIRSVEICPIVQTRVAFNRADRLAIARGTRSAPNNDESALAQSSREQVAGLKKTSKTEISKSGESGRIQIIGSPKSCREAFTKPTLLQPPSHGVSLIDDHHGFKDFASDNTTAGTFLSLHSQPVFASATLPHKIAEMRSGAPSESIHEPIEKTGPLVSPQASKSLSASDSTKLSLIKAAPTVDKAEQAVVGVKSAATSPFTGGKVMKSATTSPFSQWGIAPTSAGTFPRAEANALLPHTGQGLSEPAKTSTASHHESAQLSTSVVPPRRAIIRPNSSEFASCECLDATMPNLFPAPGSPRPTAGLLDPHKSPRSGAHSTSELTKSIIGNEASTRKNLIQPAPTITETNSKKGLIRPDIKPASMREKSPRLSVTLSPHETNASSLRTTGNISVTTGTTAANFSDSSPVNRSHPGSPVYMTSVLLGSTSTESWSPLVASSVPDSNKSPRETTGTAPQAPQDTIFSELWTPRAASGVLDPTKSHRSSPGTTVVLRTTQAVSGILDSTKSPIRSPGIIPEASVTGLFPEQWTPQTASGFLDPTKSPRISSGTSDEASRCRLYLEPWTPLAASGFLDTTKSLRGSAGTSLGPKTPQAASGLLDTSNNPFGSPKIILEASQGGLSPELWTPLAASSCLDPTKSPRISNITSDEAPQGHLSLTTWTPVAASGLLDSTKSPRGSPETASWPRTPQAASSFLDPTKSPRGSPGTTKTSRSDLTYEPKTPQAGSGPLDPPKSTRGSPVTTLELRTPQAVSGFLDSTKNPRGSPGSIEVSREARTHEPRTPQAGSGLLHPAKNPQSSPVTTLELRTSQAVSGFLDPNKSPRGSPATTEASRGALTHEPRTPQPGSGLIDQTKNPQGNHLIVELRTPQAVSGLIYPTKSPRGSPETTKVSRSALTPEPSTPDAPLGLLDPIKNPRDRPGTTLELRAPPAASGLLDPTKSPRGTPATTSHLSDGPLPSLENNSSHHKLLDHCSSLASAGTLDHCSSLASAGTLDPTKSPRLCLQESSPASKTILTETLPRQTLSPQPPGGSLSSIMSPLTPSSQVEASIARLSSMQHLANPPSTMMEFTATEKLPVSSTESGPSIALDSTVISTSHGAISTLGQAGHPVTVFDPSQSETSMVPATVMSPGESSFRSPGRARNALSTGSPSKNSSDLASPGEIRKLLEAKGDPAHLSPQHRSSPTDMPSSTQPLARPISPPEERHKQAETKERTVRSEGSRPSLTEKSLELKLPSSPFASSQTAASEKKPHRGSSLHVLTSTGDKPTRMSSGRGPTELDKTESATFIVHGTQAKTGIERQELSVHSSPELVPAGSTTGQFETSSGLFPDVAEKSRITTPEIYTKGSPQRNKGQSSHKGHNALKGSKFSIEDLSFSEHIAHAISESSADFADIPLQVNMTIDLVPPKSPMSPPRAIMSPVHIEKKMIVESYKDGHVEVKVPPVYIDVPDGKRAVDEALNVSVSVDVGKKVPQDHKSPEEGSHHTTESHRPEQSQHPEESHHDEK